MSSLLRPCALFTLGCAALPSEPTPRHERLKSHRRTAANGAISICFASGMILLLRSALLRRGVRRLAGRREHLERIAVAVLANSPDAWPRKVRTADHHVVGNCAVHEPATRRLRLRAILIVGPLPA